MRVESFAIMSISKEVAVHLSNPVGIQKLIRAINQFHEIVRTESQHWLNQHSISTLTYYRVERVIEGINFSSMLAYHARQEIFYYTIVARCANEDENKAVFQNFAI